MYQLYTILLILLAAIYFDLKYMRIPNTLCIAGLTLGIAAFSIFGQWENWHNLWQGALLASAVLIPLFAFRLIGGGDVKLMIVVGALSGPALFIWALAYGIILGAITSLFYAAYKTGWHGIKTYLVRYWHCFITRTYFKPGAGDAGAVNMPYAPALALGWLLACYLNPQVMAQVNESMESIAKLNLGIGG